MRLSLRQTPDDKEETVVIYNGDAGNIAIDVSREGQHAVIRVSDTGVGIAASDLPHVFDRFYVADVARQRSQSGTGLGLSIVKALVEQQGGTVEIESLAGRGTTVTVRLECPDGG